MIHEKRLTVVLPAYNAAQTLRQTVEEIPPGFVDDLILVDDASIDDTAVMAREMGLHTVVHDRNLGYGGNQKTCYREALARGADVVIMLHPDYQYSPKLVVAMASLVALGQYDVVLGSRIVSRGALEGGMPLYKYIANRFLTWTQNIVMSQKLSEYHTGYRAFSRRVLEALPLAENSNGFVFDNQMLAQALYFGFSVGEISCPARYEADASMISFGSSVVYGLGVLQTSLQYRLAKWGILRCPVFPSAGGQRCGSKRNE
ncbi:MAG: glycosyltransferase family 2 protein [Thermoanaerobaculales bacterium]|nr:glycosyltransferase family 2 protein [Thermoanaerobaculales bacterium]